MPGFVCELSQLALSHELGIAGRDLSLAAPFVCMPRVPSPLRALTGSSP